MYRDDHEAARARIESLEGELASALRRIAARERVLAGGCRLRDHLAAMERVAELEAKLASSNPRSPGLEVSPELAALDREVLMRRTELGDLQLLGAGDEAMLEEISTCQDAIQSMASEIETLRAQRALLASIQVLTIEGQARAHVQPGGPWRAALTASGLGVLTFGVIAQVVGAAMLGGLVALAALSWWRCSVVLLPDGLQWDNGRGLGGGIQWDEVRDVRFLPDGELRIRCHNTWLRFRPTQREFPAVARAVIMATARHAVLVTGTPPAKLGEPISEGQE